MLNLESVGVSNHLDPEKSKARGRSLVKMRVVNRNTRNLQVPHGNVIDPGVREIYCYDDEVAAVKAMVEPKVANIPAARERYMLAIAKQVGERLDPPFNGTLADLAERITTGKIDPSDKPGSIAFELSKVLDTTPSSVEGAFYETNGRSLYPLDSAEVIDEGIPEPQRKAMAMEQEKQAGVLANALRSVLKEALAEFGASAGPTPADVDARVEAKVRELLGEKTAKK